MCRWRWAWRAGFNSRDGGAFDGYFEGDYASWDLLIIRRRICVDVVLFERWVDASMTRYYGYEQSGDAGTTTGSFRIPTS